MRRVITQIKEVILKNETLELNGCIYFWPEYIVSPYRDTPPIKFDAESGCWLWQWSFTREKRPRINFQDGSGKLAYRYVWENEIGPIDPNHHIHHKQECKYGKKCVNPDHKESLSIAEHRARHS